MSTSDRPSAGQMFGRYQIVRLIGEGGMGAVYEALHPLLKKQFAIKILLPSTAETPELRTRFLREGEAASRINHPNVVVVSDVGTEGDTPYLVMEYLEGEPLSDLLARRRRLEVTEAADLLLPVISAVVAGHDNGVVHRDLKPQNVFLARGHWGESIPKVLDFGVSKLISGEGSASLTGTLTVLGTAAYMSPEQARGSRDVDGRSDQYALGLVLYEMLTAARAHPGDSLFEVLRNIATGTMVRPREARPDLPEDVLVAMERMLALAPGDRFPTLRAAGRALFPFASDRARAAIPDAFGEPGSAMEARTPSAGPLRRTLVMPDASQPQVGTLRPEVGGTLMLPEQPDTRFSRSAGEIRVGDSVPQRSGWVRWLLGIVAVGAAAAAILALLTRPRAGSDVPRASVAVPAPPLETLGERRPTVPPVAVPEPRAVRVQPPEPVRVSPASSQSSSQRPKRRAATTKRESPKATVPNAPILD